MQKWLAVLLAIWIAHRINKIQERLWAENIKIGQADRWQQTVMGMPLAPELPTKNRHVLTRASN